MTPEPDAATEVVLDVNLSTEPPSLEPSLATDSTSIDVLTDLMTGLTVIDAETAEVVPGLARVWDVSEDGTGDTFNLAWTTTG